MAEQKLRYIITGDATQLNAALNRASVRLKAFGQGIKNAGASLARVSMPLALAGGAAIKMGVDFDKSMTKIKSLVGVAGDDVDKMRSKVREMAVETGVSSSKAADALFFITSAGLRGEQAMSVLQASLKASAVGLGEVATVADLSTSAMNAYAKSNLTATEATDVLTASVREGKLNSEELASSMGQVLPTASAMGVQFHEVGAAMAAMSRTGTNAAIGATQLKSVLNSLLKPSKEAEEQLAEFGLSAKGLRQQIKDEGLLSVLNTLKENFDGNSEAAQKVFPNVRALSSVLNLTGDNAEATEKIFAALNATQNDTQKAFEETSKSASFRLTKSLNEAKESFAEMGAVLLEALLPVLQDLAKFVSDAFKKFNNLEESTQKFIGTIVIVGTVLGPVLMVIGSLISALGTIAGALGTAKTAFKLLNKTMRANPFIFVAGLILGVVTALQKLKKASDAAKLEAFNDDLKNLTVDEAQTKLAKLNKTFKANKEILDENNKLSLTRRKFLLKDADGVQRKTADIQKENNVAGEQIKLLQDFIKLKKEEQVVDTSKNNQLSTTNENINTNNENLRTNVERVNQLSVSTKGATAAFATLGEQTEITGTLLTETIAPIQEKITQFGNAMTFLGQEIMNAFANAFESMMNGESFFKTLGKSILGLIKKLVAAAAAALVLSTLLGGVGIGKIGKTVTSFKGIFGAITGFAKGGIVSTPTLGLMGEYPGARSNPEVIAPLDRLRSMIGDNGGGRVQVGGEFTLRGQDLVVALQRANRNRDRIN